MRVVLDRIPEKAFHVLKEVDATVREVGLLLDLGTASRHRVLVEGSLLLALSDHLLFPFAGEILPQGLMSSGLGGASQTVEGQDTRLSHSEFGGHFFLNCLLASSRR